MPGNGPVWTTEGLVAPHHVPDKAARVRRMFNDIAPRYAFVNALFSAGRDTVWRREAVRLAKVCSDDAVLDVACGTGDFARAFAGAGAGLVVGADFAHEMVKLAVLSGRGLGSSRDLGATRSWCEGDAMHLPFRSEAFTIASCAFGVRNFADLHLGLTEMYRVLRPGGRVVILEFTTPRRRVIRWLYHLYSNRLMPMAATLISGDRGGAYRYLPRSVVSFLNAERMSEALNRAGFERVSATPLTMEIVTVYVAQRG